MVFTDVLMQQQGVLMIDVGGFTLTQSSFQQHAHAEICASGDVPFPYTVVAKMTSFGEVQQPIYAPMIGDVGDVPYPRPPAK